MKLIKTEEAIGQVLCHDITQIIKGVSKQALFRKGHIITAEDIPVLLNLGKDHLFIWEDHPGYLHENEAAEILASLCCGANISCSEVKEGKIELAAACDGLLKVDNEKLIKINSLGEIMIASRHGNVAVKKGDKLAGTRIIPLMIAARKIIAAQSVCGEDPILNVRPFIHKKVGIIATGNELFYGRIEDTFTPVLRKKLAEYDTELIGPIILDDDDRKITDKCLDLIQNGADLVLCTGGMSVDPDDRTPAAIKNTGAKIIAYGVPVLPGAMFMLAYYKDKIPIVGLPGCVMYAGRTVFDLILPRIMAQDQVTIQDLTSLGQGGLCLSCPVCVFPNCGFGKGVQ